MSEARTAAAGKMPALQPARRSLFIRGHSLVKPDAQAGSPMFAIAQAASFSSSCIDDTLALELPFLAIEPQRRPEADDSHRAAGPATRPSTLTPGKFLSTPGLWIRQ